MGYLLPADDQTALQVLAGQFGIVKFSNFPRWCRLCFAFAASPISATVIIAWCAADASMKNVAEIMNAGKAALGGGFAHR